MTELDRKVAEAWEKRKAAGNTDGASYSGVIREVISEFERSMSPDDLDILLLKSNVLGSFSVGEAYHVHTRVLCRLLDATRPAATLLPLA